MGQQFSYKTNFKIQKLRKFILKRFFFIIIYTHKVDGNAAN